MFGQAAADQVKQHGSPFGQLQSIARKLLSIDITEAILLLL
jgi:hypothetical protein